MVSLFTKVEQIQKLQPPGYLEPIMRISLDEATASVRWNENNINSIERVIESKVLSNREDLTRPNDSPAGSNSTDGVSSVQSDISQGSNVSNSSNSAVIQPLNSPSDTNGQNSTSRENVPGVTAPLTAQKSSLSDLNCTTVAIVATISLIGAAVLGVFFVRSKSRTHWTHDPLASDSFETM